MESALVLSLICPVSRVVTTATVATGSVDVDTAAAVTDDFPASPALTEEPLGREVEEEGAQTEALGDEDGEGTYAGKQSCRQIGCRGFQFLDIP